MRRETVVTTATRARTGIATIVIVTTLTAIVEETIAVNGAAIAGTTAPDIIPDTTAIVGIHASTIDIGIITMTAISAGTDGKQANGSQQRFQTGIATW